MQVKNFSSREELEKIIKTTNPKEDIVGTREELSKFQLSDKTTVYGLRCVITDAPTQIKPQQERPQRGKIYDFGVNYKNNNK